VSSVSREQKEERHEEDVANYEGRHHVNDREPVGIFIVGGRCIFYADRACNNGAYRHGG
jgi:hypothetical protein